MNMITALLGATALLLAAAVTLSVIKMNGKSDDAEIKKLRAELAAISAQQSQFNPSPPVPSIDPNLLAPAPAQAAASSSTWPGAARRASAAAWSTASPRWQSRCTR